MARLLLDECCPPILATMLREAGHDVLHALEAAPGTADSDLATTAEDQHRILVTYDYDFGELAVRRQMGQVGVILAACQRLLPTQRHERIVAILADDALQFEGKLTVIEEQRIRQRAIGP